MRTPFDLFGGQPGTTWDNLKSEVVPRFGIDNQGLTTAGDGWDNLFISHAHARGVVTVFSIYKKN